MTLARLLYQDWLRRPVGWLVERRLGTPLERVQPSWWKIERQRRLIYSAIVPTVDRVIELWLVSPHVAGVGARLWGGALKPLPGRRFAARRFRQEHGSDPPWFLVISPTQACHLRCAGCYADSGPSDSLFPEHSASLRRRGTSEKAPGLMTRASIFRDSLERGSCTSISASKLA